MADETKQPQAQDERVIQSAAELVEWLENEEIGVAMSDDALRKIRDTLAAAFSFAPTVEEPDYCGHPVGDGMKCVVQTPCPTHAPTVPPAPTPEGRLTQEEMEEARSAARQALAERPNPNDQWDTEGLVSRALLQLAAAPGSGERECDEHCYDAGESGFRAGLETAARYMESHNNEFYAREIRALSPAGSGEGRELREALKQIALQVRYTACAACMRAGVIVAEALSLQDGREGRE